MLRTGVWIALLVCASAFFSIGGCSTRTLAPLTVKRFVQDAYPAQLSQWQLLRVANGRLQRTDTSMVYQINTPLFSDYTSKLRMIVLPQGAQAEYHPTETFRFPVGTIIAKTFYYDKAALPLGEENPANRLLFANHKKKPTPHESSLHNIIMIETRLLVRQSDGWDALPYVWNEQQTDATLRVGGDLQKIGDAHYVVPSKAECASCHSTGIDATAGTLTQLTPIGPKARHLHRTGSSDSSLTRFVARDWLTGHPKDLDTIQVNAQWDAEIQPKALDDAELNDRSRSYLDANCGHCHSENGSADTSQLMLDRGDHSLRQLGRCKPPIAAGKGTGGNLYALLPGQPDRSILVHRMSSTDPSVMMPELGRTQVHDLGVELIAEWVARMTGECL